MPALLAQKDLERLTPAESLVRSKVGVRLDLLLASAQSSPEQIPEDEEEPSPASAVERTHRTLEEQAREIALAQALVAHENAFVPPPLLQEECSQFACAMGKCSSLPHENTRGVIELYATRFVYRVATGDSNAPPPPVPLEVSLVGQGVPLVEPFSPLGVLPTGIHVANPSSNLRLRLFGFRDRDGVLAQMASRCEAVQNRDHPLGEGCVLLRRGKRAWARLRFELTRTHLHLHVLEDESGRGGIKNNNNNGSSAGGNSSRRGSFGTRSRSMSVGSPRSSLGSARLASPRPVSLVPLPVQGLASAVRVANGRDVGADTVVVSTTEGMDLEFADEEDGALQSLLSSLRACMHDSATAVVHVGLIAMRHDSVPFRAVVSVDFWGRTVALLRDGDVVETFSFLDLQSTAVSAGDRTSVHLSFKILPSLHVFCESEQHRHVVFDLFSGIEGAKLTFWPPGHLHAALVPSLCASVVLRVGKRSKRQRVCLNQLSQILTFPAHGSAVPTGYVPLIGAGVVCEGEHTLRVVSAGEGSETAIKFDDQNERNEWYHSLHASACGKALEEAALWPADVAGLATSRARTLHLARTDRHDQVPNDDLERLGAAKLLVLVDRAVRMPRDKALWVQLRVQGKSCHARTDVVKRSPNPVFGQVLVLGDVTLADVLDVVVWDGSAVVGTTELSVRELVRTRSVQVLPTTPDGACVLDASRKLPAEVLLSVQGESVPMSWPRPVEEPYGRGDYAKHVLMICRGGREELDPFVALARGLADQMNYLVTVCAELEFLEHVHRHNAGLSQGCIRFRPIARKLPQTERGKKGDKRSIVVEHARFMSSFPVCLYWVETLRPDIVAFSFSTSNIAILTSEALHVPVIGFILQPTAVAFGNNAMIPVQSRWKAVQGGEAESQVNMHADLDVPSESNELSDAVAVIRKEGGLRVAPAENSAMWINLLMQRCPMLAPLDANCCGGDLRGLGGQSILTNFIFLRGEGTPALARDVVHFADHAKRLGRPLVALVCGQMCLDRPTILRMACQVATECAERAAVVVLVGDNAEPIDPVLTQRVHTLKSEGWLFEDTHAELSPLFQHADCVVMHGSVGVTAEALLAGCPSIVAGSLYMDELFWGKRVYALGCGPEPLLVNNGGKDFRMLVSRVQRAIVPDNEWAKAARRVAQEIRNASTTHGVTENVAAFVRLQRLAKHLG